MNEHGPVPDPLPRWRPNAWQTVLWAISPCIAVLITAAAEHGGLPRMNWESITIRWTFFLLGIMNMYAFSAVVLRSRDVDQWEIKAIPVAGVMAAVNAISATLLGNAIANAMGG